MIQPATIKAATYYGIWASLWMTVAFLGNAIVGYGEYGLTAQFVLGITGLPLALLSWQLRFDGSINGTLLAAAIGVIQWSAVAEANARWEAWRNSRHG